MRNKPHILFVTEKWCDTNPDMGLSNNYHTLFNTLRSTDLASFDNFYYDECVLIKKYDCDKALLKTCEELKPDLIIFTQIPGNPLNPKPITFELIEAKLKIPTVAIWFDSVKGAGSDVAQHNAFLAHILIAGKLHYERYKNPIVTWGVEDPSIFNSKLEDYPPKDIDISYIGSLGHKPIGRSHLASLKYAGIAVITDGGTRERPIHLETYADYLKRSKISLNFPKDSPMVPDQLKGRTFEIVLCEAMLLEPENDETKLWLTPYIDYIPYSSKKDLIEKAKYYIAHKSERRTIARSGCFKATQQYNAHAWWNKVLSEIQDVYPELPYQRSNI